MEIIRCVSADEAKKKLAERISSELVACQEDSVPALLLFSGGSALGILDLLDAKCAGSFLTIAPVDERCDPSGHDSNFGALVESDFFRRAVSTGVGLIDTRVKSGQGRDALADAFGQELARWRKRHPKGRVIAILGMGPDGHTAGIFPMDDGREFSRLFEGERMVVGYRAPEYATCPDRVTVTLSFLCREVESICVFFSGEEKRAVWKRVLGNTAPMSALPAIAFHTLSSVEIFTDIG